MSYKKENEKKILMSIIDVLEDIEENKLSLNEGEKIIFSPKTVRTLMDNGYDSKLIDIVEEGCELEDIESLIPEKLNKNIILLKNKAMEVLELYK